MVEPPKYCPIYLQNILTEVLLFVVLFIAFWIRIQGGVSAIWWRDAMGCYNPSPTTCRYRATLSYRCRLFGYSYR